jgi:CelD/BcsL family acetyltransferase involved in cellulose biosynthesis
MMNTLMAREFAALGVTRIDLGKGDEPYKLHFRSGGELVAEGAATGNVLSWSLQRQFNSARRWARQHAVAQQFRTPLRWYRQLRDWFSLA